MKSKILTPRFFFLSTIIVIAALSRVFPHIPNFSPIAAIALFGGVYFTDKRLAFIIPMIAMLISDCILQLTTGWGFHNTIIYVYIAFIITSAIGLLARKNTSVINIAGASIISSVLFFAITNFGYWAANGFALGLTGLSASYISGIPFFAPTLLGDLFFNAILFGAFYLAQVKFPSLVKA